MIALYHGAIQFAYAFDAFARVGVITDYVAQAHKMRAPAFPRVRQYCFERFEIRVDVTKNCKTHGLTLKR